MKVALIYVRDESPDCKPLANALAMYFGEIGPETWQAWEPAARRVIETLKAEAGTSG